MFENEVFLSMFGKVFAVIAVIVIVAMPFAFKKIKYAGGRMGFITIYSALVFSFLVPAFAGHLAVMNAENLAPTWVTYILGLNAIVGAGLCYYNFFGGGTRLK